MAGDPRLRKALVTLGTGPAKEWLNLTLPSFLDYGERHHYEVVVGTGTDNDSRPPAWAKVPLIRRCLARYDVVLWVDSDAMILRQDKDILDDVSPTAFQGLVITTNAIGEQHPNSGVWLLRSSTSAEAFLDAVWRSTSHIHHPMWENAAVLDLLGWDSPQAKGRDTEWDEGTAWLSEEWNSAPHGWRTEHRIKHWYGLGAGDRRRFMRRDAALYRAHTRTGIDRVTARAEHELRRWGHDLVVAPGYRLKQRLSGRLPR